MHRLRLPSSWGTRRSGSRMLPRTMRARRRRTLDRLLLISVVGCGAIEDPSLHPAFDPATAGAPPAREPAPHDPLRQVFFGDLHVHTSYSSDAYVFGVRALPDDAYRFAKGGEIPHAAGYGIQLRKPLDFLAVTDHSEFLGVIRAAEPDLPLNRTGLRELLLSGSRWDITRAWLGSVSALSDSDFGSAYADEDGDRIQLDTWRKIIEAAEHADDPGTFSAFVGYEWSSWGIHRNIVYGSSNVPERPFSSIDSPLPGDLWRELSRQNDAGQPVIAIPHNGNESGGRMYPLEGNEDGPIDAEHAALRLRIEPINEILQVKGASETHPKLSQDDGFASFEIVESLYHAGGGPAGSYARDGLRRGLELERRMGFNPYVFGVIGSSDSHNASSPVEEDRHHGKLPMLDGSPSIRLGEALLMPGSIAAGESWGGGGLAAAWAEENTRASLFAAFQRRETFATSGPRIRVRFFGGWGYDEELFAAADSVLRAYTDGVPMGGTLAPAPAAGSAPSFAVWALMDPDGAHLDRIQIIKGWVDAEGQSHEEIFDVAGAGGRVPDPATASLPPVGNTVDVASASYVNSIGAPRLEALWRDPDFDPAQRAFYYARVLEIPTPRFSTFDARTLGVEAPEPTALQERAITSAIWYAP